MRIHHQHLPRSASTQYRAFSSRLFRIGFMVLGVLLLVDLPSVLFSREIGAALTPPASYRNTSALPAPSLKLILQNILAQDTFQRANQSTWGVASDGQRWQRDAMSSQAFAIVNHTGQILKGNGAYDALLGPRFTDAEVVFRGSLSRFSPSHLSAALRWTDVNNWYEAYFDGSQLILFKRTAGVITELNAVPFIAQAGRSYTLRFRILGSTLLAKVWPTRQAEPSPWMVRATDSALASGYGGLRMRVQDGATVTITFFELTK